MVKNIDTASRSWVVIDTFRGFGSATSYNDSSGLVIYPDINNADAANPGMTVGSGTFTWNNNNTHCNSADTYIYAAFA